MNAFEEKIKKDNFSLGQVKIGQVARPDIIPTIDNQPVPVYQLEEQVQKGKLTKEQAHETLKKYKENQKELQLLFKKGLKISQDFQQKLASLERSVAESVVKGVVENLKERLGDETAPA